jgi:DHA2 family multidrug resistance protein-like MFS transporter
MQGTARVSGQTLGVLMMALLFGQMALDAALPVGFAIAAALALAAGVVSLLRILT